MKTIEAPAVYGEVITVVVDEENDFFPGGALGVAGGEEIIDPTNNMTEWTRENGGQVILTRDKHELETVHFNTNGGPWPVHCVRYDDMDIRPQGAEGAALHPDLTIHAMDTIASKGMSNLDDGYSGMEAQIEPGESIVTDVVNNLPPAEATVEAAITRMVRINRELGKRTLVLVLGLATDYCIKETVLGALNATDREWVDVVVIEDAVRAVNLAYDDGDKAMAEMKAHGAQFMESYTVIEGGIIIDRRGER